MIDFTPTDEQRMLIDTVRRFVRTEIVPLESDLDPDAGELPPEEHRRLSALAEQTGLRNWEAPAEVGGPGLDTVTQALLAIEMSQHRAGLYAPCYGVFGSPGLVQLVEGTEEQKRRYLYPTLRGELRAFFGLSEPSGGSDPAGAIRTTAVPDGDDWVITGTKLWISDAHCADYGLVLARTGSGTRDITAFLVDTASPGFTVRRIVHTLRTTHPATELELDGVRVPDANRVGEVHGGFALAADRLVRGRIPYAAGCLGVALVAHRMAVEYASIRETFGRRLADQQGIQWMLVDNEIDLRTTWLLILAAARRADLGEDIRADAAIAKLVSSEAAGRVVDRAIQIHGGLGVSKDLPLERWYRELRIRRIGEGPSEVQRLIVARHLLGGRGRRERSGADTTGTREGQR
jgi:acyl-CoA dehydrogenase